jgi:hypothetical protein
MFLKAATIGLVMSFANPQRANKLVTRMNGTRIDLGTGDVDTGCVDMMGFSNDLQPGAEVMGKFSSPVWNYKILGGFIPSKNRHSKQSQAAAHGPVEVPSQFLAVSR